MRYLERQILLQIIDNRWREHLYEMDYLREGIHLRGFAQIDPLVAYKNEGFTMFQELMASIWEEFVRVIFHVEVNIEPAQAEQMFGEEGSRRGGDVQYSGGAGEERPSAMREAQARRRGDRRRERHRAQPRRPRPATARAASTRRPWSRPRTRRSAATTPAGAARARSTRSATAPSGRPRAHGARDVAAVSSLAVLAGRDPPARRRRR